MVKTLVIVFGIVFILVGLLGFIHNPIVGSTGFFLTDTLHNIVHLLIGIVMLFMAGSAPIAALNTFGAIYLVLAIVGFIQNPMTSKLLGLVRYNSPDNWLHLVLAVVLLVLGLSLGGKKTSAAPAA